MKLRLLAASLAAFGLTAGLAVAQTAPAPQAPAAAPVAANKPVLSYAIGYDLGKDLAQNKVDVDINTVIRAIQDGYAQKAAAHPEQQMTQQLTGLQQRMMAAAKAEFDRVSRENKAKSDAFMSANRAKADVKQGPNGILYRVIDAGSGAKPTAASTVVLRYRAAVSTGQEFANNFADPQGMTHKLAEFPLKGVRDMLMQMPTGARYELFLPPEQAFGMDPRSPVGPGQAIVFDVKIESVK
jgi:FKBP-type peptidyl-prolyl cis-trans isomerase